MVQQAPSKRLNIGVIGIGVGGLEIIRAIVQQPDVVNMAAGCDVVPVTRERFQERFPDAKVYDTVEKLCQDPDVDAVYVASPNRFHAEHTITAARHGKHVLVEKPMAISLKETEQMVAECEKAGVHIVCAHTASYSMPYRVMRKIIQSGELGKVRAIQMIAYTDWMLRPRTPDELDFSQGGGVPYRQGPHQLDTIRLLGGGLLRSVRATIGEWMPERPIPGYYNAHFEFQDGAVATAIHNGYGYFLMHELDGPPKGSRALGERVKVRKEMQSGTRREDADKQDLRIGGAVEARQFQEALQGTQQGRGPGQREQRDPSDRRGLYMSGGGDPGFIIVSCERGDMRNSPEGVWVYDDNGVREVRGVSSVHSRGEIHEMYDAIVNGKSVYHGGHWGMATAEAIFGMVESSQTQKEVIFKHQVAIHTDYDADLRYETVSQTSEL